MGITSLFKLLYLLFSRCGLFTAFSLYDFTQLAAVGSNPVSYTHLDVYKRQAKDTSSFLPGIR